MFLEIPEMASDITRVEANIDTTRRAHVAAVRELLADAPVVAILGARQVGKTTLARVISAGEPLVHWFDLEDPRAAARLAEPTLTLEPLRGLVVLDEVQHAPELFPVLRVLADRPGTPARFLVLGSAAPELLRPSSESLAGRVAFYALRGFDMVEVGTAHSDRLWLRGGSPRSFLAATDAASARWRRDFARTWLERDVPAFGIRLAPEALRRFWTMLAHLHGQVWNGANLGRAFGVTEKTARHYLDVLAATFMVTILPPWHENVGKRQVRSPKVYLSDSGLLHHLLGLSSLDRLLDHPVVGASWEGFVLAEATRAMRAEPGEAYFWATHAGAELDLLVIQNGRRLGVEVKRTDAPVVTASMRAALETLRLDELVVVHAGRDSFPLADRVRALSLADMAACLGRGG